MVEQINSRMDNIQSPIIPLVGELISQHPDTISLGQGIVAYPPPQEARESLVHFWSKLNNHKYKSVQGIPELLSIIKTKLEQENGIEIGEQNAIIVTAGSNMGFINAILAITQPGDEIILQTPYYFNHEMAIGMVSCSPVLVATDENYQPCPDEIRRAITDKTKAVVTISPNNPTGTVYAKSSLQEINKICEERNIYHISDEAYEYFTYDGVKHYSPASFTNSSKYTISLFSLSKAYGFASWRIGYMVIPDHLLLAVKKVQDTILICPPVVSQYAAVGALRAGLSYCQEKIKEIKEVRNIVLRKLRVIDNLCTISKMEGAFYVFLKIHASIKDFQLVERLIKEYRIAAIPGTTFGMVEGCYLRVAYGALEKNTALEGSDRLVKGLKKIIDN
jgi:aspartate/methionine/tyrosine aminotransferase